MIPWTHLDKVAVPGGGELRLLRRGDEFSIMLGSISLMNSRLSGSEEALATLVGERLAGGEKPRILIGGLGMGFTLRAALSAFAPDASIVVVELMPAVIEWARGPMAELFAGCLDDPRVIVRQDDVANVMRRERGGFDAILLDVDNGPDGLTRAANDGIYGARGISEARAALRLGGILAVWSQGPDDAFERRLRKGGFAVDAMRVRATRSKRGSRHLIWLAKKTPAPLRKAPPICG